MQCEGCASQVLYFEPDWHLVRFATDCTYAGLAEVHNADLDASIIQSDKLPQAGVPLAFTHRCDRTGEFVRSFVLLET